MNPVEIDATRDVIVAALAAAQVQAIEIKDLLRADEVDWRTLAEALYVMRLRVGRAAAAAERMHNRQLLEICGVMRVGRREE